MPRIKTILRAQRRRLAVVGCLLAAVTGAAVVYAKADFSISPSPTSQTVAGGQAATYTVTLARTNGFTSTVGFTVSGLPAGTTATFTPSSLTTTANSTVLKLQTSSSTPAGTYTPTITATGASVTHTATITLVVTAAATPDFTIAASPAGQTVPLGASATYTIQIARSGGFSGPVSLSVSGMPNKATAAFSPSGPVADSSSSLTVNVPDNGSTGVSSLQITGTATINGSTVTRQGTVTLTTEKGRPLGIAGQITQSLGPGITVPIDVALTNSNNFDISVTSVAVAVEQATSKAACKGLDNFAVTQMPAARYPLTVPANTTKKLSDLNVPVAERPTVRMVDLPNVNQDACKGATFTLDFSGTATK